MSERKKVKLTTPVGSVKWFSLSKVDKFGNYTCQLVLSDSPETHDLISKIDAIGEGKKPYEKQADGSVILKLKQKREGEKRDGTKYLINPPALYDSLGKRIQGEVLEKLSIGNGSTMRAKIEVSNYEVMGVKGVSVKPKSVQFKTIVEFGDSDEGFDALEFADNDHEGEDNDDLDF